MLTNGTKNAETDSLELARRTHGFTGSDLGALITNAHLSSIRRALGPIKTEKDSLEPAAKPDCMIVNGTGLANNDPVSRLGYDYFCTGLTA